MTARHCRLTGVSIVNNPETGNGESEQNQGENPEATTAEVMLKRKR